MKITWLGTAAAEGVENCFLGDIRERADENASVGLAGDFSRRSESFRSRTACQAHEHILGNIVALMSLNENSDFSGIHFPLKKVQTQFPKRGFRVNGIGSFPAPGDIFDFKCSANFEDECGVFRTGFPHCVVVM